MQSDQETSRGLNILCIDGGGVRGVSCLIILKEVMNCVALKADRTVHPHEYFDFIAGAGTGGISACMLGRLRMPIDKAMSEYAKLMKEVFKEKKMTGPTMYKGTKLQGALKTMVREATGDEEEMMSEFEDIEHIACKTIVFAKLNHTHTIVDSPVLFRSYAVTTNPGPDCTIWEASYATMALPNLFKSIIVKSSVNQSFVGGELGYCNPIAHVLLEVHQIYPDRQIASIISIGAGHTRTIQAPSSNSRHFGKYLIAAIKDITIDSEKVAEEMEGRFEGTSGVYFRFNVEQGLQNMKYGSWEMLGDATQHTRAYLQKRQTSRKVEDAARASMERRGSISTKYATGETLRAVSVTKRLTGFKSCPAPTKFYTGNEDENTQVIACINGEMEKLCVCVVYGLGGVGKTQLVLKVVERTWKNWDHIIYVDASSTEVIENALGEFGTAKKIGEGHKDVISWLESCGEHWLVIFDNADTLSTNVQQYIPRSARGQGGSVIITTRLPDLASLADGPGFVCHLSSMSQADATALLVKIASLGGPCPSDDDIKAAETLVQDFGCLALAIVHAGAYIAHSPRMTITKYRHLFLSQRRRMLDQYNELPATAKLDKHEDTVYTTWRMCYDQLKPESRELLWLIAYLHYDDISADIFERAAQEMHLRTYPLPLTDLESQAYSHVQRYLSTFLDSNGSWDSVPFTRAMADLTSYSLIEFDRMNLTYRMHVLVHDWAKTVVSQTTELAIEYTATLLSLSIDLKEDDESLAFKRRLGPHVTSVLIHGPQIGANHKHYFKEVYRHTGQWIQLEKIMQQLLQVFQKELGDDGLTPETMKDFANTFLQLGRWDDALHLQIQCVSTHKRVLGEYHPDTLVSMSNLASTYLHVGRYDEAEQLQAQVLSARKRVLGEDHPNTLVAMNNLALIYLRLGRYDEAEQLQAQVLSARKRVLGEDHPYTLVSMSDLASTYSHLGRYHEAEQLQVQVLNARERVPEVKHPDTPKQSSSSSDLSRTTYGTTDNILIPEERYKDTNSPAKHGNYIYETLAFLPLEGASQARYLTRGSAADVWVVQVENKQYVCKVLRVSTTNFEDEPTKIEGNRSGQSSNEEPSWRSFVQAYRSQVSKWSAVRHTNLIRIYDHDESLNLHVEYCHYGSVRDYLKVRPTGMAPKRKIIYGVLQGLRYLHNQDPPIIHGSLNAGKVFVDDNHQVKIGEFGLTALCYHIAPQVPSIVFTGFSRWMSPELLDLDPDGDVSVDSTLGSDIWALACTIYEIIADELPYSKYSHDIKIQRAILKGESPGDLPFLLSTDHELNLDADWELLLKSCWSMHPSKRPTVSDLIEFL
ncbi:calcium-independent phospholipase A2-gamma, putative, partial [Rhizoctonia solani AG-3 Rhs1AP]